jgi:hypothetical protein
MSCNYCWNQPIKHGKYDFYLDGKLTANEVVYKTLSESGKKENVDLDTKIKDIEKRLDVHFTFQTVTELPEVGDETVIYLKSNDETSADPDAIDTYNEYMWVKDKGYELIGSGTYEKQKADLNAEIEARIKDVDDEEKRAKAAEQVLTDNLAKEVTDRTNADTALNTKIEAETKRATGKEATIDAELAKRVPYSLHKNISVVGNTKDVVKLDVPDSSNEAMYCPQGLIMGGSAQDAGLVTRGICGITFELNTTDGSCSKENLYINYDGDTTYKDNRQLILQAGRSGEHYGHNLYQYAAARGDAVKGYVDAQVNDEKVRATDVENNLLDKFNNYTTTDSLVATYATKDELNGVDGKFANYVTIASL